MIRLIPFALLLLITPAAAQSMGAGTGTGWPKDHVDLGTLHRGAAEPETFSAQHRPRKTRKPPHGCWGYWSDPKCP